MSGAAAVPPITDPKDEEIYSNENNVGHGGLKTQTDLEQRQWFNIDQKESKHDSRHQIEGAEQEEMLERTQLTQVILGLTLSQ